MKARRRIFLTPWEPPALRGRGIPSRKKIGVFAFILFVSCYLPCLPAGRFLASSNSVFAFDTSRPNNKFGIHLAQPGTEDIKKAAALVNSSGGRWGYVTLVIQENDRDHNKWQDIFDRFRELHLIPIIRLATRPEGAKWKRPQKEDADSWVNFLDSLNWVVKDRYIVLFNEPNHGSEWGGTVDPENYADVATTFAEKLKNRNKDFFIMLAGLDSAAPSQPPLYEDEGVFLRKILDSRFQILNSIDGWSSHSYPNPGYRGSPYNMGRNTIANYQWELSFLKSLGVDKELSVFITETGWPHRESNKEQETSNKFYPSDVIGAFTEIAYQNVWLTDDRVRAVTPFVLNYQGEPFAQFSWVMPGESETYAQYSIIQKVAKTTGSPEILEKGSLTFDPPHNLLVKSSYHFQVRLTNEGEAIWDRDEGYLLRIDGLKDEQYTFSDLKNIRPNREAWIDLYLKTDQQIGNNKTVINLYKKDSATQSAKILGERVLSTAEWDFTKLPLPEVQFVVHFFPQVMASGNDLEIQIFDKSEKLVFKKKGVQVKGGAGILPEIQNIAIGEKYRMVILRPYYLPRQTFITFKKDKNQITFKAMLPFDLNKNGHLDWGDLKAVFF